MILYITISFIIGFFVGGAVIKKFFIERFIKKGSNQFINGTILKTKRDFYPTFSEFINELSPRFAEIYDDILLAENYELSTITGIAYGKSLEILIRDYAIYQNPEQKEAIIRARLVNCIKNYIKDASIKNSSDIARWLRNDETHYERKYEKAEVTHLKKLIQLTVALINQEHEKCLMDQEVEKIKDSFTK